MTAMIDFLSEPFYRLITSYVSGYFSALKSSKVSGNNVCKKGIEPYILMM